MSFLGALFGEIKGVLGKAYLLSGLLPALLLLGGWIWFTDENALEDYVGTFGSSDDGTPVEMTIGLAVLLGLGLAFFAARSFAVHCFQTLTPAPRWMRRWLVRRQLERRAQASYEIVRLELRYTAVRWACDPKANRRFYRPVYVPEGRGPGHPKEVLEGSARARQVLERMSTGVFGPLPVPAWEKTEELVTALTELYVLAYARYDELETQGEIPAWRDVAESPMSAGILQGVADSLHGETNEAQRRLGSFPERPWVRPTALGSRASALDDYGATRYGIPTGTLLTRLIGVLDREDRSSLADSRLAVEVFVVLSLAMIALSLACLGDNVHFCLRHAGELAFDARTAAFVAMPALLALLFYRSSILAYDLHSVQVKRMVDLHRLRLIRELGHEAPSDVEGERKLWKLLATSFRGPAPAGVTRLADDAQGEDA